MSGVAKDDTNPNSPADVTVPVAGESEAPKAETQATPAASAQAREEAETRSRRSAPHLRVVTDSEAEIAPSAPLVHQRIGDEIRAARENTGFTLEQVSRETRVHISHLRAIEDMTPGLLGAPVYAKGYIKSYARFLGMDEQTTLDRYLSECAAILKDPEKVEIAQPASSKARKLPVAVPVLGILVVALVGGGGILMLNSGDKSPAAIADNPSAAQGAGTTAEPVAPQLRIVALKRSMLEVRSAKGDKYVHRYYNPGEFFVVRVGAGFTVTAEDGAAFEWRLGDQSLGLLQPEGGPVYSQNVDLAAQRQPIVIAPPVDPTAIAPVDPSLAAYPPGTTAPANPAATPAPAKPKPPKPAPATNTAPAPAKPAPAEPAPPVHDPALDAYPDQVETPATPPAQ